MEFLKALFADKTLTWDEFVKAIEDHNKAAKTEADKIKIANLASGAYVDRQKFDAKDTELKTANDTITTLQADAKKYAGVDVDGLKNQITETENTYKTKIAELRRDTAVDMALVQARARNPKAARALLDISKVKVHDDGTVEGIDVEALKKTDPYLFEIEQKKDEGSGHAGGTTPPTTGNENQTARDEIASMLFGSATTQK